MSNIRSKKTSTKCYMLKTCLPQSRGSQTWPCIRITWRVCQAGCWLHPRVFDSALLGGTQESAFLMSSQVMLMLLVRATLEEPLPKREDNGYPCSRKSTCLRIRAFGAKGRLKGKLWRIVPGFEFQLLSIRFFIYKMGIVTPTSFNYIIHLSFLAYSQESLASITISCKFKTHNIHVSFHRKRRLY